MTFPDLRLVTAPSSSATVLLDLNATNPGPGAAPREVQRPGLSFGAPGLDGDVDAIEPLYGPRTIQFTVRVTGSKAQASAFLSSLARIVLTGYTGGFIPGLWLRAQMNALTQPVWFRLRRPRPQVLSWAYVAAEDTTSNLDIWDLPLELPAEPFAYGTLETIAAQTVNNDPTAGTNPCRIDLGTIKGDAPAPLRIQAVPSALITGGRQGLAMLYAAATAPTAVNIPIGTGDGLTAGADTAAAATVTAAIGGSERTVDFATDASMVTRLSGISVPSTLPGRYKVLLTGRVSAFGEYALRFTMDSVVGSTKSAAFTAAGRTWFDLGEFNIPVFVPQQAADQGPAVSTNVVWSLAAQRVAGSGTLTLDHLLLIPVTQANTVECRGMYAPLVTAPTTMTTVLDGDTQECWAYTTATGALGTGESPKTAGVTPRVVPGVVNTLWFVNRVAGAPQVADIAAWDKTHTASVTCFYYPRYLEVPGA